jgi:ATP dependent DNA ligase domain
LGNATNASAAPERKGRNADRFSTIATVAATLEAHSFTIDGKAVVIGPDGIAQFDQLRRRNGAKRAMLFGFDLIELNGVDLRSRPLLERKTSLAELIDGTKSGIMLNDHLAEDGDLVFSHACRLGAEGIVSKKIDASTPQFAWRRRRATKEVSGEGGQRSCTFSFSPRSGGLPAILAIASFNATVIELPRVSQYSALSGTTRSTRTSGSVGPFGHHACASLLHSCPAFAASRNISARPVMLR